MRTEIIILGILFLLGCILDYMQFKEELRDLEQEDEPKEEPKEAAGDDS